MVAFVVVSHSAKLAEGIIDLAKMSAPEVTMIPAGGLEDGSYGTSFGMISDAIKQAYCDDGVIVLVDLGSAVMTTEMVLESLNLPKVRMTESPMVTAAVTGTVLSAAGAGIEEILEELNQL